MRTASFLAFALGLCGLAGLASRAPAQPKQPPKAMQIYGQFRELMADGKYDIAIGLLQQFLDANPSEQDLLDIEKKHGTTVFTQLRTIPKWSDDAATEKKARATVEEVIKRAREVNDKLLRDPARVGKFIRNLGATYEERVFAEQELKRTGDFAIPFMVDELRALRPEDPIYIGLLGSIKHLEGHTIAGWIAALDGLPIDRQADVISAIAARDDLLKLQTAAQTDLTPILWRYLAIAEIGPSLRQLAERLQNKLKPGTKAETRIPVEELAVLARTFYDHTARFAGVRTDPKENKITVPLWLWDAKTQKVVLVEEVPIGQAEEYYGLRYARWALERKPDYEPAQMLILALVAERAIERCKFGDLAKLEPAAFKLLSDAPSGVLIELLDRGMTQKKTALVLAMLQVLGDRADRDAASPKPGTPPKPSSFERALDYKDTQVQYAAANALLRSPVPIPPALRGKIVEILRAAAATDPLMPADKKGTALIADPSKNRADAMAVLLRGLGYNVEVFTTGRDLLRRVGRASDFDLIFVDHHTPNPELIDLVGQLQASTKSGERPTFVVASADRPRMPTFDQLLVRFSALIAATENEIVLLPPPFVPDSRDAPEDIAKRRKAIQEQRDNVLRNVVYHKEIDERTRLEYEAGRTSRLKRLIASTGVDLSEAQRRLLALRVELIAYAVLAAEFPISPESAPDTFAHIERLKKQIALQPPSPPYGVGTPTADLVKLMERFELDLARVPSAQKRFEDLYSKLDAAELGLPVESFRDPLVESKLTRTLRNYPEVRILPEPYSRLELESALKTILDNPAQAPRDGAAKKDAQRGAVQWLSRMATGELDGFETKPAEAELRAALRTDDLAASAIEAVVRFGTAEAQQDLLALALTTDRPLPLRTRAAEAVIRHIRVHGKSIPPTLLGPLAERADKETDLTLRGKLLTLTGMLVTKPATVTDPGSGMMVPNPDLFVNQLKGYNPPLLPAPLAKDPPKKDPMMP